MTATRRRRRSQLAAARKAAGFTQEALAYALHVDRSTVIRWEAGQHVPVPYLWPKLVHVMGISRERLQALLADDGPEPDPSTAYPLPANQPVASEDMRRRTLMQWGLATTAAASLGISADFAAAPAEREFHQQSEALIELRQVVIGRHQQTELPDTPTFGQAVNRAHQLYQHADYDAAAQFLPSLIAQLDSQPASSTAAVRRTGGYIAAAKLATKLGDSNLAWLTADRAHQAARESENPALVGIARYQVACALLCSGHLADAQLVTGEAVEDLAGVSIQPENEQPILSALGALLLLSSIVAARNGEATAAQSLLRRARSLAEIIGRYGNWLWTGFGPTNVAIHELSVAVELGDSKHAHAHGAAIDTDRLPSVLVSRRSQVHLDLSRAAADLRDDGLAVLHLLEAERVAKQAVSRTTNAHRLISTLLSREQRNTTPGLRALATRAGIAYA